MNLTLALKNLNHHAYCIVGGVTEHAVLLESLLKDHKIGSRGNPDFIDRKYESFTIDDARTIKSISETRPTTALAKKVFILEMVGITIEAQNAILKLLEEPPANTHFFIIISSAHLLLPTVKSRLSFVDGGHNDGNRGGHGNSSRATTTTPQSPSSATLQEFAEKFVKSTTKQRLDLAKIFADDITKEKRTKQDAVELLNILEEIIHDKGPLKTNFKKLEALELVRKYSTDRAPSMKMLLDYAAMSL